MAGIEFIDNYYMVDILVDLFAFSNATNRVKQRK